MASLGLNHLSTWSQTPENNFDYNTSYHQVFSDIVKMMMYIEAPVTGGHPLKRQIDGLVQERRNSSALAMELHLSCTNQ